MTDQILPSNNQSTSSGPSNTSFQQDIRPPETSQNLPTNGTQISPPPATLPSQPAGQTTSNKKGKWWVLLLLLVLAALGAGAFLFYRHSHQAKPVNTTTASVKRDIPLLRIGTGDAPINVLYPSKDSVITSGFVNVNNQIFEGLVGWNSGAKIVPVLATSWTNPDDTTWIFNLRQGVKFHSGRTMTADDVKYSLDKFSGTYADSLSLSDNIKSVDVMSADKVKITTKNPDPLLLNRLTYFFIIDSHNSKAEDSSNGTGPYIIKPGTDPVKDKVTDLVAYDGYWGGHVYTRELQFSLYVHEADEVAALKLDKIDLFDNFIDATSISALKSAGIKLVPQPSTVVDMLALNTMRKNSPLSNIKIRQAIDTGIDRKAIFAAGGLQGTAIGQFMVQDVPGYDSKLTVPTQNVSTAKTLVAESGVKNPSLELSYGTDTSNKLLLTELQKECAAIGITIKLDPIDDLGALIDKYQNGNTDMIFIGNSTNLFDGTDVLSVFQIPGVYDNSSVDGLLTKANGTLDGAKRLTYLQQAADTLNKDVAGIALYYRTAYYAQTSDSYTLKQEIPGVNIGTYFWKVYQH